VGGDSVAKPQAACRPHWPTARLEDGQEQRSFELKFVLSQTLPCRDTRPRLAYNSEWAATDVP
jgi:hypothetical protein